MPNISKKKMGVLIAAAFTAILCFLGLELYQTYKDYEQMTVERQEQNLLITSRAVAQNLKLCFSEQIGDLEVLTGTSAFQNEISAYYENGDDSGLISEIDNYMETGDHDFSRIYLFDREGSELHRYNCYPFLEDFDESILHIQDRLIDMRTSGIGSAFRISPKHYGITTVCPLIQGEEYRGMLVGILDIDFLYRQYMAGLESGGPEYLEVKNERGTVIMYPDSRLLTFNYFRDIENLNTDSKYQSLREMLDRQYSEKEGSAIYTRYTNDILQPAEEVASFSRMNLGDTTWYISAVTPYSVVTEALHQHLMQFVALVALIIALISSGIILIYVMHKQRQKLQMEADHLREMNQTLRELHESREKVEQYQRMQTIGAFVNEIAHEFNNLLTPILSYSELLENEFGEKSEHYEDVHEIHEAGLRAKEIVNQILPFGRGNGDSTALTRVSLDAVLTDALKMLRSITPKNIHLNTDIPSDEQLCVRGNATQLHEVILNLCSNAFQAMSGKGGTLTVAMRRLDERELPESYFHEQDKSYVQIEVTDTGCGIAPDVLPHIFDAFYTTKKQGEGIGIGLSVVRNILINYGGYIEVRSKVGVGSSFFVYLPIMDETSGN